MRQQEMCDPCMISKKTSYAKHFCDDCEERLCERCVKSHAKRKATASHTPVLLHNTGTTLNIDTDKNYPGKPIPSVVLSDEITLTWDPTTYFGDGDYYQISNKEIGHDRRWRYLPGEYKKPKAILKNLKSNASFIFRVRAVYLELEGPYSETSDVVTTCQSLAFRLATVSTDVWSSDLQPAVLPVPMTEVTSARHETGKIRTFEVGEAPVEKVESKTILLVGSTGSGKSTLVDGFINHVLGVNWDDPFRFTVKENWKTMRNKALSQEDWITCYTINPDNGSHIRYQLNIIDTPGFGDTRGVERDQAMVNQIRILFTDKEPKGITHIDAVCFILKAPDARLTLLQMYIFQSIMSLFGNDVERNICTLITFADGKEPPVFAAVKASGLPFGCTFAFNNCALYTKTANLIVASLSPMFWDMSLTGFRSFFKYLDGSKRCSLDKTRDVLHERFKLEGVSTNLQQVVDSGLIKMSYLRQELKEIEEVRLSVENNKMFEIMVKEEKHRRRELPRGQDVTNCLHCNISCHIRCTCSISDKSKCRVMNAYGYGTVSPGKSHWQQHATTPYILEIVKENVKKTFPEKRQKYLELSQKMLSQEKVVENLKQELKDIYSTAAVLMTEVQTCTDKMKEIALQDNPFVMVGEHIDVLLENEKLERKEGFLKRISLLKEMQKRACMLLYYEQFREEVKRL